MYLDFDVAYDEDIVELEKQIEMVAVAYMPFIYGLCDENACPKARYPDYSLLKGIQSIPGRLKLWCKRGNTSKSEFGSRRTSTANVVKQF